MQFIMVDIDLIKNKNISNDEIIAYSLLCDRMKSSRTSQNFFDVKMSDYYVIYTLEEMAESLKVSIRKVSQIFAGLVKKGFLTKKKQFSRADKLFLPKMKSANQQNLQSKPAESASPKMQNMQPNQSQVNQKNQSEIDTVNTKQLKKSKIIEKWKNAVSGKLKLNQLVIDQILKFTNQDVKKAHRLIGIIINAKTNVAKNNGLLNSPISRFESNVNLGAKLATKLNHVFSYIPAKLEAQAKYLTCAMKKFFLEAFGLKKDELVQPVAKSSNDNRDLRPSWMKNPDELKPEPFSKEEVTAVEKKLAKIRSKRKNNKVNNLV
ncbi:hypothetical protein [Nicoliella lavandulae]|uniref:Replication initiator protein A C-terminal domain-containing protein n=1 Tax=Nicoliella lavandulae TaxID=3082954 RepID=A0ABU8SLZ8_9LACO